MRTENVVIRVSGVTFDDDDGRHIFSGSLQEQKASRRQEYLRKVRANDSRTLMRLVREPDNIYSPAAVAVIAHTDGKDYRIGYVPQYMANVIAPIMDAGENVRVCRLYSGKYKNPWTVTGRDGLIGCKMVLQFPARGDKETLPDREISGEKSKPEV